MIYRPTKPCSKGGEVESYSIINGHLQREAGLQTVSVFTCRYYISDKLNNYNFKFLAVNFCNTQRNNIQIVRN